jgi:hypothetical protein
MAWMKNINSGFAIVGKGAKKTSVAFVVCILERGGSGSVGA